jgi:hypothetical protein
MARENGGYPSRAVKVDRRSRSTIRLLPLKKGKIMKKTIAATILSVCLSFLAGIAVAERVRDWRDLEGAHKHVREASSVRPGPRREPLRYGRPWSKGRRASPRRRTRTARGYRSHSRREIRASVIGNKHRPVSSGDRGTSFPISEAFLLLIRVSL